MPASKVWTRRRAGTRPFGETTTVEQLRGRLADLTAYQQEAAARERSLETVIAALCTENTDLNTRLGEARIAAAAADARADSVEARYTQLLTVLSDPAQRGAAVKGPDA
ncbi:hypothetical protein NLX85_18080 [Micromonospora sp. A3M-1-15]|uniref:hypothetical protein n=1 Tax=Micromonospora sp. A3M-1-15 TaxID=2962035 RepID=UPI0020B888E2|nr:hypothetical protein [Micromonospora sp. A3M-1-15]MCP3785277.1 hypothetical protein [Micromonospora sp. A3M-1-15]